MDFFNLSVDVFVGSRKMLVKSLGRCKQIRVTGLAVSRHLGEIKAHINLSYSSSQSDRFLLVYSSVPRTTFCYRTQAEKQL